MGIRDNLERWKEGARRSKEAKEEVLKAKILVAITEANRAIDKFKGGALWELDWEPLRDEFGLSDLTHDFRHPNDFRKRAQRGKDKFLRLKVKPKNAQKSLKGMERETTFYHGDRLQYWLDEMVAIPPALALLTEEGESEEASLNLWIEEERNYRLKQARVESRKLQRRERLGLSASATDADCIEAERAQKLAEFEKAEEARIQRKKERDEAVGAFRHQMYADIATAVGSREIDYLDKVISRYWGFNAVNEAVEMKRRLKREAEEREKAAETRKRNAAKKAAETRKRNAAKKAAAREVADTEGEDSIQQQEIELPQCYSCGDSEDVLQTDGSNYAGEFYCSYCEHHIDDVGKCYSPDCDTCQEKYEEARERGSIRDGLKFDRSDLEDDDYDDDDYDDDDYDDDDYDDDDDGESYYCGTCGDYRSGYFGNDGDGLNWCSNCQHVFDNIGDRL